MPLSHNSADDGGSRLLPVPCGRPLLEVEAAVQRLLSSVLLPLMVGSPSLRPQLSSVCGLEWWIHTRRSTDSMFLHFDRDEWSWQQTRQARFPLLASVLAIQAEDAGGPTLIVNETTDAAMTQLRTDADWVEEAGEQVEREAARRPPRLGWLVWPMDNGVVVFPGSWLHGVVAVEGAGEGDKMQEAGQQKAGSGRRKRRRSAAAAPPAAHRVTLMVNVWCEQLSDPSCLRLTALQAQSPSMQRRYGRSRASEEEEQEAEQQPTPPLRVELDCMDEAVLAELYDFSLLSYVEDERPRRRAETARPAMPLPVSPVLETA